MGVVDLCLYGMFGLRLLIYVVFFLNGFLNSGIVSCFFVYLGWFVESCVIGLLSVYDFIVVLGKWIWR